MEVIIAKLIWLQQLGGEMETEPTRQQLAVRRTGYNTE